MQYYSDLQLLSLFLVDKALRVLWEESGNKNDYYYASV